MLELRISASTAEELKAQLAALCGEAVNVLPAREPEPAPKVETKEPAPEVEPEAPVSPEAPVNLEAPAVTAEEARAALNELRKTKGVDAVRAILTAHNVRSFTELTPADYADVLKEAQSNG